jgi:hypothetical protein
MAANYAVRRIIRINYLFAIRNQRGHSPPHGTAANIKKYEC